MMDIKRNPMKVVGCGHFITIRRFVFGRWNHIVLTKEEFIDLLKREFPDYLEEYEMCGNGEDIRLWFYNYGQKHIAFEDAYIFR